MSSRRRVPAGGLNLAFRSGALFEAAAGAVPPPLVSFADRHAFAPRVRPADEPVIGDRDDVQARGQLADLGLESQFSQRRR